MAVDYINVKTRWRLTEPEIKVFNNFSKKRLHYKVNK